MLPAFDGNKYWFRHADVGSSSHSTPARLNWIKFSGDVVERKKCRKENKERASLSLAPPLFRLLLALFTSILCPVVDFLPFCARVDCSAVDTRGVDFLFNSKLLCEKEIIDKWFLNIDVLVYYSFYHVDLLGPRLNNIYNGFCESNDWP